MNTKIPERYSRNILIESVGASGQEKLMDSKVLIAGAGGLGSSVISNLASVGIGTLGIVDSDRVELSNLNRQYIHSLRQLGFIKVDSAKEWINKYNPDINVFTYNMRLDEGYYREVLSPYDIIIDCFDTFESKFFLNRACFNLSKPLIHGGATELSGQVMLIIPGKTACLNCILPEDESEQRLKGILSPAASIIGSIQAMEAVRFILGIQNTSVNSFLRYDGIENKFKRVQVTKNLKCKVCNIS